MKKKLGVAILVLLVLMSLTACTIDGEPISSQLNPDTSQVISMPLSGNENIPHITEPIGDLVPDDTELEDGLQIIVNRTVVNGKIQSYLTGEWKSVDIANRRPMAVMVPNNKAALPQYGISKASIIYEAPMEALSCTRLMCVFEDYDSLDHIGPVRSSRLYFLEQAMSLDAIYCHWGLAVPYVGPVINTDRVDNISAAVSGINNPSDEAFGRDEARKAAGYALEFTGIMTISGYNQAVQRQGYLTTRRDNYEPTFLFAQDGYLATYDDMPNATKIAPGGIEHATADGGYANGMPYFVYNAADHLYYRWQYGARQMDEENDTQLTCTNIIFKMVNWAVLDEHGYLILLTDGTGPCYMFTNGKIVPGTWERDELDNSADHFYDMYGEEMVLNQGKTWVCLILDDYADCIYAGD